MPRYQIPAPLAASINPALERENLYKIRADIEARRLQNKGLQYTLDSSLPPDEAQDAQRQMLQIRQTNADARAGQAAASQDKNRRLNEKAADEQNRAYYSDMTDTIAGAYEAYESVLREGGSEADAVAAADAYEAENIDRLVELHPERADEIRAGAEEPFDRTKARGFMAAAGRLESPESVNFVGPDGKRYSAVEGTEKWFEAVSRGDQLAGKTSRQEVETRAVPEGEDFGFQSGTKSQQGKDEREFASEIASGRQKLNEFGTALQNAVAFPETTGVRGLLAETVGGYITQIDKGTGESFVEALTGVSPAQLAEVRTQARMLIAPMVKAVTGDPSRYSDRDMQLAENTLAIVSAAKTGEAIASALMTIMEIEMRGMMKTAQQYNQPPPFSLDDAEGVNKLGNRLMAAGFTEERAVKAITELRRMRNAEDTF